MAESIDAWASQTLTMLDSFLAPDRDDERRRYYRITQLGRAVVKAEADRMVRLADSEDVRALAHGVGS